MTFCHPTASSTFIGLPPADANRSACGCAPLLGCRMVRLSAFGRRPAGSWAPDVGRRSNFPSTGVPPDSRMIIRSAPSISRAFVRCQSMEQRALSERDQWLFHVRPPGQLPLGLLPRGLVSRGACLALRSLHLVVAPSPSSERRNSSIACRTLGTSTSLLASPRSASAVSSCPCAWRRRAQ